MKTATTSNRVKVLYRNSTQSYITAINKIVRYTRKKTGKRSTLSQSSDAMPAITINEIKYARRKLKVNAAPGGDGIVIGAIELGRSV